MIGAATGEVRVVADEHGFTPGSIAVPKGGPGAKVTVTFVRTTEKTCATEVVFPDLQIEKPLPLNVPVPVEVPATPPAPLPFSAAWGCSRARSWSSSARSGQRPVMCQTTSSGRSAKR